MEKNARFNKHVNYLLLPSFYIFYIFFGQNWSFKVICHLPYITESGEGDHGTSKYWICDKIRP